MIFIQTPSPSKCVSHTNIEQRQTLNSHLRLQILHNLLQPLQVLFNRRDNLKLVTVTLRRLNEGSQVALQHSQSTEHCRRQMQMEMELVSRLSLLTRLHFRQQRSAPTLKHLRQRLHQRRVRLCPRLRHKHCQHNPLHQLSLQPPSLLSKQQAVR